MREVPLAAISAAGIDPISQHAIHSAFIAQVWHPLQSVHTAWGQVSQQRPAGAGHAGARPATAAWKHLTDRCCHGVPIQRPTPAQTAMVWESLYCHCFCRLARQRVHILPFEVLQHNAAPMLCSALQYCTPLTHMHGQQVHVPAATGGQPPKPPQCHLPMLLAACQQCLQRRATCHMHCALPLPGVPQPLFNGLPSLAGNNAEPHLTSGT